MESTSLQSNQNSAAWQVRLLFLWLPVVKVQTFKARVIIKHPDVRASCLHQFTCKKRGGSDCRLWIHTERQRYQSDAGDLFPRQLGCVSCSNLFASLSRPPNFRGHRYLLLWFDLAGEFNIWHEWNDSRVNETEVAYLVRRVMSRTEGCRFAPPCLRRDQAEPWQWSRKINPVWVTSSHAFYRNTGLYYTEVSIIQSKAAKTKHSDWLTVRNESPLSDCRMMLSCCWSAS